MKSHKAVIGKPGEKRRDIAITDEGLWVRQQHSQIQVWQEVIGPVPAARANDSANFGIRKHVLKFPDAARDASGKKKVSLEDGIEIIRNVSQLSQSRAPGSECLRIDIAGGSYDSDGIARQEGRRTNWDGMRHSFRHLKRKTGRCRRSSPAQ